MASSKTMTAKIAEDTSSISRYVKQHPGCDLEQMAADTGLNAKSLFQLLAGMTKDTDICDGSSFRIMYQGQPLTIEVVKRTAAELKDGKNAQISLAERLLYLYHCLHNALPDGGLTFDQLMKHYDELTGETKTEAALKKMIFRDLRHLEGMNITLDRPYRENKRYCLQEVYLPKLGPESAAAIYVCMMLFNDTVLDRATDLARQQISKAFIKRSYKDATALGRRFLVTEDTLADPGKFGDKFEKLIKAVMDSYRTKIEYTKLSGEVSTRVVEPLGMLCKRGVWYMVAVDTGIGERRTFRVDQIEDVYPRENEKFKYPADFSLEKHLGDSWGVFGDDEVQDVVLKFTPHVARRVQNLKYHRSQELIVSEDGSVILKFHVCGLKELKTWVMQWGEQVEVLEPKELREKVRETALAVAAKYM